MHKIVQHPGINRLPRTREYLEQRGSWEEQPEVKLQTVVWALASCADVFDREPVGGGGGGKVRPE